MPDEKPNEAESIPLKQQKKNQKEYEFEVDQLCASADRRIEEEKFDEGLKLLNEALDIVKKHPWGIKKFQVEDLIDDAKQKKQTYLERKKRQEEKKKLEEEKREKEKRLIEAKKRLEEKERKKKEARLKALQAKKQKEEELSSKAFDLLEKGTSLVKENQFDEALENYNQAKSLFQEIKWKAEALRVDESISELRKQREIYIKKKQKAENEQKELEKQKKEQEELIKSAKEAEKKKQDEEHQKLKEKKLKEKEIKEKERQALEKLERASELRENEDYTEAITLMREARGLFNDIEWQDEADKILTTINKTKDEKAAYEKRMALEKAQREKKKKEEEELERQMELQRQKKEEEEKKRQAELQKKQEQEKHAKSISTQAFKMIEDIETEVAKYKEKVSNSDFSTECPYSRARTTYSKAKQMLEEIGWNTEANKLTDSIQLYAELEENDKVMREKHRRKQEKKKQEQEQLEQEIKRQKSLKEQERKKREELQRQKDEEEKQQGAKHERASDLLEKGNVLMHKNEFDEALSNFNEALELFKDIKWKQGINLTQETIIQCRNRKDEFDAQQSAMRLKKEEAEKERAELQKMIEEANTEEEKRRMEAKKRALEKQHKKEKEDRIQQQIIDLITEGNELANKKEFKSGIAKLKQTFPLFEEIDWGLKRTQVRELIDSFKQREEEYNRQLEKKRRQEEKQRKEEQELQKKIQESQMEKKKRDEAERQRKAQQIAKEQEHDGKKKAAFKNLDLGNVAAERKQFEKASTYYNIALEHFQELDGWKNEVEKIKQKMKDLDRLIEETYRPKSDTKKSDEAVSAEAYSELDEAAKLNRRKKYDEALRHIKKAKSLFTDIGWDKAIKMCNQKLKETGELAQERRAQLEAIEARRAKKNEEDAYKLLEQIDIDKKNRKYSAAIDKAKQAQKIFRDLGWTKEADDLDHMIEALTMAKGQHDKVLKEREKERLEKIKKEETEEERLRRLAEERRRRRRERRKNL